MCASLLLYVLFYHAAMKTRWNETLSELKCSAIAAHNWWKAFNRPRSGEMFMHIQSVKVAYKNEIKAHRMGDYSYFSNELLELLFDTKYGKFLEDVESQTSQTLVFRY